MKSYVTATPVEFPYAAAEVYTALCDLPRYPLWNTGMKTISATEPMRVGLEYVTTTAVAGHLNKAHIIVERLSANEEIELVSQTGLIHFRAYFRLIQLMPRRTEVICTLRFELHGSIFVLARSVIEGMARTRIRNDLERLSRLMAGDA